MNKYIVLKKNAIILPSRKNDFGGGVKNGSVLFGIHDVQKPNSVIYNHKRLGVIWADNKSRYKFIKNTKPIKINGNWMYGGPIFNHFGHFMAESIHRLWGFRYLKDNVKGVLFHVPIHWFNKKISELPDYMIQTFNLFDLFSIQIKFITELSCIEQLYIPYSGTFLGENVKDWYIEENKNILEKIKLLKFNKYDKVFFSRKKFLHKGRILGLGYFESLLSDNGFKIILPEELSLKEQLYIVYNSECIVFEEGSAVHLLELFPSIDSKIFMIRRREGADSYIDSLLKEKSDKSSIYKDVVESKLYFESDRRDNVSSRLKNFNDFINWLIKHDLIDINKTELSKDDFFKYEMKDMLDYLKNRLGENNKNFNFLSFRG